MVLNQWIGVNSALHWAQIFTSKKSQLHRFLLAAAKLQFVSNSQCCSLIPPAQSDLQCSSQKSSLPTLKFTVEV